MMTEINKGKGDEIAVHADLPGHSINGGILPHDVITISQTPDMVLINRQEKKTTLFELNISFEKMQNLQI